MPKCSNCKVDNHLDRKTCKSCGQAIFSDEGQSCAYCHSVSGPFAKFCRSCGREFKQEVSHDIKKEVSHSTRRDIKGNIQMVLQGDHLRDWDSKDEVEIFKKRLKRSYLYKDKLFGGMDFSISKINNKLILRLNEMSYSLTDLDELENIFDVTVYRIPKYIKDNAYEIFKPLFRKYNNHSNLELLSSNLGNEDVLLTFKNQNNQLASMMFLPIFEDEIEKYINKVEETCSISSSYLDEDSNADLINSLTEMFETYHYNYRLIEKKEHKYTYKIGNKTISIISDSLNETLTINYLKHTMCVVKEEFRFLSILLVNWMMNSYRSNQSIHERLLSSPFESTQISGHFYRNNKKKNFYSSKYPNVYIEVPTENIINFRFKNIALEIQEPIFPNMDDKVFEKLINKYLLFSTNTEIFKLIKVIEDSTSNHMSISDVSLNSCNLSISTTHVVLSSIYLTKNTTFDEVIDFIQKINFVEQLIEA